MWISPKYATCSKKFKSAKDKTVFSVYMYACTFGSHQANIYKDLYINSLTYVRHELALYSANLGLPCIDMPDYDKKSWSSALSSGCLHPHEKNSIRNLRYDHKLSQLTPYNLNATIPDLNLTFFQL